MYKKADLVMDRQSIFQRNSFDSASANNHMMEILAETLSDSSKLNLIGTAGGSVQFSLDQPLPYL